MKARFAIGIAIAALCAGSLPASAGWFDVSNYEGKVGGKSVQLSIQTLAAAHPDGPEDSRFVIGSFYDTAERRPKAFHGKRFADGRLQLCETRHVGDFIIPQRDSWLRMKEEPCLIALAAHGEALTGNWGKAGEAAAFRRVGTWGLHDGRLMLRALHAIGIGSGKRERTATLECMAPGTICPGLLYTEVYLAGRTQRVPGEVTVGYADGQQGKHDTIVLQPVR